MGRGATFYCKTCRREVRLGYGSATSWMDSYRTIAEFDAHAQKYPEDASLRKNQRMRECLNAHEGHDFVTHSEDWTHTHGTVLCGEFGSYGACETLFDTAGWSVAYEDDPVTAQGDPAPAQDKES